PAHAQPGTGPAGPATTAADAAVRTPVATTSDPRRPSRCGRPTTPVAMSSSRSGTALAMCAPIPSSEPATTIHHGGKLGGSRASVATTGNPPNATAYGSHDHTVRLSSALYAQPQPTSAKCTDPAAAPSDMDATTHPVSATAMPTRTRPPGSSPVATGLSVRPAARSRRASSRSFDHPMDSCPASTATSTTPMVAASLPAFWASRTATIVTAAVGPAWAARAKASVVRPTVAAAHIR